jgi:hypothetical protein
MATRSVVVYPPGSEPPDGHECQTRNALARQLASVMELEFAGELPERGAPVKPGYVVPGETLLGPVQAMPIGITHEHDLFGGVVTHAFASTKAITHPLVEPNASAPEGWPHELGPLLAPHVLAGFTVFSHEDAVRAGERLLGRGPIRLKPVCARGGLGQQVVRDRRELDQALQALQALDGAELSRHGLVLEEDLAEVTTRSVGQVRLPGLVASYHGIQRTTPDNEGVNVYGGSDLVIVRGGHETLMRRLKLAPELRQAIEQANAYDQATERTLPGFFASRRNYDVAQGRDAAGRWRSGVLEQSWRLGGASGAEILALAAFKAKPDLEAVRARTVELYGPHVSVPADAMLLYRGSDPRVGPLTKFAVLEPHANA